jgi:protein O-GlcNAc transferase
VISARYPPPEGPRLAGQSGGTRVRVGFVSGKFRDHAVWRAFLKGWISNMDREKFSVFGYHIASQVDGETGFARRCVTAFHQGRRSLRQWRRLITDDQLDVLVYPEVCHEPIAIKLAAMRLAPVECAAAGHCVTTGLPTMDYFLSGSGVEPEYGETVYTEKLVRLPNLSYHSPPPALGSSAVAQIEGLQSGAVIFLCVQTLFKYLPQYDHLFVRIAERVGDCQFVFRDRDLSPGVGRQFRDRIEKAFRTAGLYGRRST